MNILICDPISPKGIALFQQRTEFNVTVLKQKMWITSMWKPPPRAASS